ncbi:hypothetical protein M2161_009198 [Streptomyces sp. SAI-133]|nr:hypothetical protein [Streptomyces sp. SAI-133]
MPAPVSTEAPPPIISNAKERDQQPEGLDPFVRRDFDDLCQLFGEVPTRDQHGWGVGGPDAGSADALRPILARCTGLNTEPCQVAHHFELLSVGEFLEPADACGERTDALRQLVQDDRRQVVQLSLDEVDLDARLTAAS